MPQDEVVSISLPSAISSPSDMSPAIARIGSKVLVKCEQSYLEGTIVAIKSPQSAIVVFRDDANEEWHEVNRDRITLMRGD